MKKIKTQYTSHIKKIGKKSTIFDFNNKTLLLHININIKHNSLLLLKQFLKKLDF